MQKKIKYENDIILAQSPTLQGKNRDIPWISRISISAAFLNAFGKRNNSIVKSCCPLTFLPFSIMDKKQTNGDLNCPQ